MKLFNFLNLSYTGEGDNKKTNCLWCDHTALEISVEPPHQWQCWHCKQSGNAYSFLQRYYDYLPLLKVSQAQELCGWKPGIDADVFRACGLKKSPVGYVWPVKNTEGIVVGLYKYNRDNNTWYSSPKPTSLSLLGLQDFKSNCPVWILEGHWDYAAFLTHCPLDGITVLGLCGSSWPSRQLNLLESREVVFLADNDEAGKQGVINLATRSKKMGQLPIKLEYLNWSSITLPGGAKPGDKFDFRDLVVEMV